ncbi:MAG: NADH-quinone oxidoreductase subunit NuoK [Pseudomonadota bacterium]
MSLHVGLPHVMVVAALLFTFGLICVVTRKNAVGLLMGVELILNAANLNFVAFSHHLTGTIDGHVMALFGIILAAAEACVALAIVLAIYQTFHTIDTTEATTLKN